MSCQVRSNNAPLVVVERINVLSDRMVFDLLFPDEGLRATDPRIAARVAHLRPDIPRHACINHKGDRFALVMERTSMPHLLEHCIIDFLIEGSSDERDSYQGVSRWTDADAGRACVQISMKDDLAVLRAFKRAVRFLEEEVISQ